MSYISDLKQSVLDSIWLKPCTFDELCKRDFLEFTADLWVDRWLMEFENKNMVYMRGDKYFTYKKYVSEENKDGRGY